MKSKFKAVPSPINADFSERVWCEISLQSSDWLLAPNSNRENTERMNQGLQFITKDRSHVLITGDFNYPEIDWEDGTSPQETENKATIFMEAVRDAFLIQHVSEPTHCRGDQTAIILDLVFTNEDNMITSIDHKAPLGKSHHQILQFR